MNCAVQVFTISASGTGPPGVGCIAGDCTENNAWNVVPFSSIGLPLLVCRSRQPPDGERQLAELPPSIGIHHASQDAGSLTVKRARTALRGGCCTDL